jgi:hypothetical protein
MSVRLRRARRWVWLVPLGLVAVYALLPRMPHRSFRAVPPSEADSARSLGPAPVPVPTEGGLIATSRSWLYAWRRADPVPHRYSMAFVEFDDQGLAWEPRQRSTLERHIVAEAADRGAIVVVFAHGWNHTARQGDNNVGCFEQVLRAISLLEHGIHPDRPRAVVGVYLGWRGASFRWVTVNRLLGFWDRLAAADRVGSQGDMLRLLVKLDELRRRLPTPYENILVLTGHSMGARALYSAVGPHFKESFLRPAAADTGVGFGDLVLLINPAVRASEFAALHALARERAVPGGEVTPAKLVLMTSRSDLVMRRMYPFGEWMARWHEHIHPAFDRQMLFQTAANYPAFLTHRLRVLAGRVPPLPRAGDDGGCGCRGVCAENLSVVRAILRQPNHRDIFRADTVSVWSSSRPGVLDYRLALLPVRDESTPVMVIETDGEVIPDHGESYSPAMFEFVLRLVNMNVAAAARRTRAQSGPPPPGR